MICFLLLNFNVDFSPSLPIALPSQQMATASLHQSRDEFILYDVITRDFPRWETLEEIKQDYNTLVRDTKTIMIFGRPRSLKSNIINAVLQDNHRDSDPSPNEIKKAMIRSQYEIHDPQSGISTVVTEHTAKEIAQCAAPNLKYFPVIKDDFPERRVATWMKYEKIYYRLSTFTIERLESTSYSNVRDYSLLYTAYIRRCEMNQNIEIPLDIVRLIGTYFVFEKPLMNLFRIQEPNGDIFNFCETACSFPTMSQWTQMALSRRVDGFIFMVDLMWYDEYFVDEIGQKYNRLEHAMWQWNERINGNDSDNKHCSLHSFGIMMLVNLESFLRKTKVVPPSVCPLFAGIDSVETIDWTEWCLEHFSLHHR